MVQENLNAIRVVKSFVREDREQEKFAQRSDTLRDTAERAYSFVVLFVPLVTLIMGGTIMAIMWLGGHYVVGGAMLSGDLIAFFTYASEILMSLMMVAMVMMVLTRSIACGKRIVEVLEEQPEITDSAADPALTVENGDVDFDHVYFKYHKDSGAWNLEDVCLHIDSGMTVGILGGTGSAKSTLVSLIPRLYEATEGAVSVGGHNVREYTMEALRQGCAMVLQKNTLFSGTIRENSAGAGRTPPTPRWRRPAAWPAPTSSSPACPTATTPTLSRAAPTSPAVRSSACALPRPFCAGPGC